MKRRVRSCHLTQRGAEGQISKLPLGMPSLIQQLRIMNLLLLTVMMEMLRILSLLHLTPLLLSLNPLLMKLLRMLAPVPLPMPELVGIRANRLACACIEEHVAGDVCLITCAHTHAHTIFLSLSLSHTHTHTHTLTHTHSHTQTQTHIRTSTHARMHVHAHTHTHTYTHTHTHTHTRTHTGSRRGRYAESVVAKDNNCRKNMAYWKSELCRLTPAFASRHHSSCEAQKQELQALVDKSFDHPQPQVCCEQTDLQV